MKKIRLTILAAVLFFMPCLISCAYAEYADTQIQNGRYVLAMANTAGSIYSKGYATKKVPAVVLDMVSGIIWMCQDLQEEKPVWVKTDLGMAENKSGNKRYIVRMSEWPSSEMKIPAVVLDVESGKAWTCPNTLEEGVKWIPKDLVKDVKEKTEEQEKIW